MATRPVQLGNTRTCPHCKATILDSAIVCPGCRHHLRFGSEAAEQAASQERRTAWQVEGTLQPLPAEPEIEYCIVVAVQDEQGNEVARQVVDVGGLRARERRRFTVSIEAAPPRTLTPTRRP
ncbi:MAG: hypothetical protein RLZZ200_2125 [Pseudomonadota bacterium]|jgi:uncharacterized protein YbaR (Trm112 family)